MVSNAEQRRRYRKKYPEKIKEQKRKYLDRKIKKKISENPEYLNVMKNRLLNEFNTLTRIMYGNILPKKCQLCGSTQDLQIHHKKYLYPIEKKDLVRLCRKCHVLEHQKTKPTPYQRETPLFPMENKK